MSIYLPNIGSNSQKILYAYVANQQTETTSESNQPVQETILPHLPWLSTKGTNIVNENGEVVVLRGLNLANNVWGNWVEGESNQLQKQKKDPMIRPTQQDDWVLTDIDFTHIENLGGNVVRYLINYELFAHDNPHRDANLQKLKEHIQKFNALGIYVIINLHLPQGLDAQNDHFEIDKPGSERMQSIFENEEYWNNTVEMWRYLAENFRDLPGVAGYELFSEPRVPSEAEGGIAKFQAKYNELCSAIREIDPKHILFIAEYNSKEKNDTAQTVSWEKGFVRVSDELSNIAYVHHSYEPFEYTHKGQSDFDPTAAAAKLDETYRWAQTEGYPLIVTEYGINRNQPVANRVRYLENIHAFFRKYDISAMYFTYKSRVGPYTAPFNLFGVYGQYTNADLNTFGRVEDGEYKFNYPQHQEAAETNEFDVLFVYFWDSKTGKPIEISIMDNRPVRKSLRKFFTATAD